MKHDPALCEFVDGAYECPICRNAERCHDGRLVFCDGTKLVKIMTRGEYRQAFQGSPFPKMEKVS